MPLLSSEKAQLPLVKSLEDTLTRTNDVFVSITKAKEDAAAKLNEIIKRYEDQARGKVTQTKPISDGIQSGTNDQRRPVKKAKDAHSTILTPNTMAKVQSYRVRELQAELKQRDMNTKGLKIELKDRLIQVLEEERLAKQALEEKSNDNHANEVNDRADAVMSVVIEENVPSNYVAKVSDEVPVVQTEEKEKVALSVPVLKSKKADVAEKSKQETFKKHQSPFKKVQAFFRSPAKALAKKRKARQSREGKMQDEIHVAPISASEKSNTPVSVENNVMQVDDIVPSIEHKPETTQPSNDTVCDELLQPTASPNIVEVSATLELGDNSNKPVDKPLSAAVETTKALEEKTSEKSYIKNHALKVKQEARLAKAAELRSKGQSAQKTKPLSTTKLFGGKLPLSTATAGQRQLLTQKMREKAAANNASLMQQLDGAKSDNMVLADKENVAAPLAAILSVKTKSEVKTASRPDFLLSPMSTYNISSDEGDCDSSDDESDYDDSFEKKKKEAGKKIPTWAQGDNFKDVLKKHIAVHGNRDLTKLFGRVETCDLDAIFPDTRGKFKSRNSSANWSPSHPNHPATALNR